MVDTGYLNKFFTGTWHCGPGNSVKKGSNSALDSACRSHDIQYGRLGSRAYVQYNSADEDLLKRTKDLKGFAPSLVRGYFRFKKALFPKMPSVKYRRTRSDFIQSRRQAQRLRTRARRGPVIARRRRTMNYRSYWRRTAHQNRAIPAATRYMDARARRMRIIRYKRNRVRKRWLNRLYALRRKRALRILRKHLTHGRYLQHGINVSKLRSWGEFLTQRVQVRDSEVASQNVGGSVRYPYWWPHFKKFRNPRQYEYIHHTKHIPVKIRKYRGHYHPFYRGRNQ